MTIETTYTKYIEYSMIIDYISLWFWSVSCLLLVVGQICFVGLCLFHNSL